MIRIHVGGKERAFRALPVTIGRDSDNDLPLDDTKLSRRHCRICRTPEGFVVEDLDSSNGTFVNGARCRRHVLDAGDTILIGTTSLSVEWDPEAAPLPARRKRGTQEEQELDSENRKLRQVLALTHLVAEAHGSEKLLRRILDAAIEITGAERGCLFLVTLRGLDFRAARDAQGRDVSHPEQAISESIAREAIETGRPVITEDAGGDARFAGGRSVALLKLRSVLCVPLKVPDGPVGAIYLENRDVTAQFRLPDVPFVTAFGDFAALTLSSARNLEAMQRQEEQLRQSRERIGRLNARLKALLRQQARELAGVRADLDVHRRELGLRYDYHAIVGRSPAMRQTLALLDRIIGSEIPVLVVGESGTGKELIARAIHHNGPRAGGKFVSVHCAALPPDLVEAELFGHEAGAFTGATEAAAGLFEQAHQGTLFLDEIAELPAEVQGKLLRVLESGEVRRLGAETAHKISVRLISASSRELQDMVRSGEFREDLYYRLNGVTCRLPPLRERPEDIPSLIDHFLDLFCAEQELERPMIDPEVLDRMGNYPWPGNVRELRNEVQRLVTLQRGVISPDLLSLPVFAGDPETTPPSQLPPGGIKEVVENLERRVILDTMRRVEGNKTRAAALLGLSRLGLRKKLERYGLKDNA